MDAMLDVNDAIWCMTLRLSGNGTVWLTGNASLTVGNIEWQSGQILGSGNQTLQVDVMTVTTDDPSVLSPALRGLQNLVVTGKITLSGSASTLTLQDVSINVENIFMDGSLTLQGTVAVQLAWYRNLAIFGSSSSNVVLASNSAFTMLTQYSGVSIANATLRMQDSSSLQFGYGGMTQSLFLRSGASLVVEGNQCTLTGAIHGGSFSEESSIIFSGPTTYVQGSLVIYTSSNMWTQVSSGSQLIIPAMQALYFTGFGTLVFNVQGTIINYGTLQLFGSVFISPTGKVDMSGSGNLQFGCSVSILAGRAPFDPAIIVRDDATLLSSGSISSQQQLTDSNFDVLLYASTNSTNVGKLWTKYPATLRNVSIGATAASLGEPIQLSSTSLEFVRFVLDTSSGEGAAQIRVVQDYGLPVVMNQVYSEMPLLLDGGILQTSPDCAEYCVTFGAATALPGGSEIETCCGKTSSLQGVYQLDESGLFVGFNSSLTVVCQ